MRRSNQEIIASRSNFRYESYDIIKTEDFGRSWITLPQSLRPRTPTAAVAKAIRFNSPTLNNFKETTPPDVFPFALFWFVFGTEEVGARPEASFSAQGWFQRTYGDDMNSGFSFFIYARYLPSESP